MITSEYGSGEAASGPPFENDVPDGPRRDDRETGARATRSGREPTDGSRQAADV